MQFLLRCLFLILPLHGGSLQIEIRKHFGKSRLKLDTLRYEAPETFSVTRLAYLLSQFAIQDTKGRWHELPNQFAYLDASKRITTFTLTNAPKGSYQAIRFSVGVPKEHNHGDPAKLAPKHPLNPNLNQLHWDWEGGYIFLALEGHYRDTNKEFQGFVYHLANDNNLSRIQLPLSFQVNNLTNIGLALDLQRLLTTPRALSFLKSGNSTHSHPGDPIASALVANLQRTFQILGVSYPAGEAPKKKLKPLYLPRSYTPYPFKMSRRFLRAALPLDNPLLKERVALGEQLFHDPILSLDNSISCSSCHQKPNAFTDSRTLSPGVEGRLGNRNSMPLFNLAWKSTFFWDGRAHSLREQVLIPIEDHREMAESLPRVLEKLASKKSYREAFNSAFNDEKVTSEKLGLALENFLLTLTSYDSKFDRAMDGEIELTKMEQRGMELFFTENEPRSGRLGADCFHCHGGANFSDHQLHNNGLNPSSDRGRHSVTGKARDRNLFSTPSLRNVELTAPYMHDGRFKTLEEVIAHYSGPMHRSNTLDPNLAKHPKLGLQLQRADQAVLVAFLKTLTDPKFRE